MGPVGAVVGRFRIEETLGEDSSGEIHRAVAIDDGTPAVVHVMRAEGGAARRDRLIRETRRAAQLKHEGLATVLEVGQTGEGGMFVAVERMEGERLSDRLRARERLPAREASHIASHIARALAVAHDAGVVHRNLRPSVVALSGEGDETRVKVEGLATPRPLGASGADDSERWYMAPELRRGEAAGRRADVYSIGAMLHAMLTGEPPHAGGPAPAGALGDVVRRCLADDPRMRFLDTVALGAALRMTMDTSAEGGSSRPPPSMSAPRSSLPARPGASERTPSSGRGPTPRPPSVRPQSSPDASSAIRPPAGRPPAAPPPRPLGRPLTARPRWEETLLDLSEGVVPRVAVTMLVAFVIARILTVGLVPFVVAVVFGVAAYATKYWRRGR
jgi:eukaryotic-like serine/threonine-protein kinase